MSEQIIKQITSLINENQFDEAKEIIKRVSDEYHNDPNLLIELGKLQFLMGEFSAAVSYFQTALTLQPNNYEAYYLLGLVLLKENQPEQAVALFRQACELKIDFALSYFHCGLGLYALNNINGALEQFRAAAKADKSLYIALYYAGLINEHLNQHEEARKDFSQSIALEPNFAPAYNALGTALLHLGKVAEATSALEKACKLKPDFAPAHINLATILAVSNQFEQAQIHFRSALNSAELSAKQRALIYNNLAIIFVQTQQWDAAYEHLLQAQNIDPAMFEARLNLGLVQMALQEYDLALGSFEQVLASFPDNNEASLYAGIAALCLHRYKDAQQKLTVTSETNVQKFFWLGWSYIADQNYPEAQKQFERIVANNQSNQRLAALSLDALGLCSTFSREHDQAIKFFDQALAKDNTLAQAYLHRARNYEAQNKIDMAKQDYEHALAIDPECLNADKDQISQLIKDARVEEALAHSMKILSFQPQDIQSQLLLARALKDKKAYPEALALLSSIMVQAPDNAEAYTILGQIHLAQRNLAQADEIFSQASTLPDADAELYLHWGKTLNSLGLHELAIEKYKQAADISPYEADIYENWAQTLKLLGRFDEATEIYKLASSIL